MSQYVISSLEQQWRKDPSSRVFFRLAEEYRKSGAFEKAIDVCKEGIKYHPNYLPARICLGRCRQSMGLLHQAEEDFHEVLRVTPDNPHALLGLSAICFDSGRLEEALAHCETLAIHDPYDESLVNRMLFIKEKLAEREFEQEDLAAETATPFEDIEEIPKALSTEGFEDVAQGELEPSEDHPDLLGAELEELDPLDEEFNKAIDEDEEIGEFKDLTDPQPKLSSGPLDPADEHLLTNGLKHEKMEHYEAAQHIYGRLLVAHPGNPTVRQHLERVDQLLFAENGSRKKIRLLSNWLDKIKGVYYVS